MYILCQCSSRTETLCVVKNLRGCVFRQIGLIAGIGEGSAVKTQGQVRPSEILLLQPVVFVERGEALIDIVLAVPVLHNVLGNFLCQGGRDVGEKAVADGDRAISLTLSQTGREVQTAELQVQVGVIGQVGEFCRLLFHTKTVYDLLHPDYHISRI